MVEFSQELLEKAKKQLTNKQLLCELGKRIVQKRLKFNEGIEHNGFIRMDCDGERIHHFDILDNEWEEKAKPDYTGFRCTLTFALADARSEKDHELTKSTL